MLMLHYGGVTLVQQVGDLFKGHPTHECIGCECVPIVAVELEIAGLERCLRAFAEMRQSVSERTIPMQNETAQDHQDPAAYVTGVEKVDGLQGQPAKGQAMPHIVHDT